MVKVMDRIWYSSDTHLILASVSWVSNEYQMRIKRVCLSISLIRIWYSKTHGGQLPPMGFWVSNAYQALNIWYSSDTHLILIWYAWYRREYQMSIRWVSEEYRMFCYTECMECMILMILKTLRDAHDTHKNVWYLWYSWYSYGTRVCRIFGFV